MAEHPQLGMTQRNRLLEEVQRELLEFERQEIEFRKKDREERAAALHLPLDKIKVH